MRVHRGARQHAIRRAASPRGRSAAIAGSLAVGALLVGALAGPVTAQASPESGGPIVAHAAAVQAAPATTSAGQAKFTVNPATDIKVQAMKDGFGVHTPLVPGTFRPTANKDNDYLIDRAAQRAGKTFSGVTGIAMQDASLQESMGPIVDRTREKLVSTDNGIIMARQRLIRAARALADKGVTPPGTLPEHHQVRSAALILSPEAKFDEAAAEALRARPGVQQTSI